MGHRRQSRFGGPLHGRIDARLHRGPGLGRKVGHRGAGLAVWAYDLDGAARNSRQLSLVGRLEPGLADDAGGVVGRPQFFQLFCRHGTNGSDDVGAQARSDNGTRRRGLEDGAGDPVQRAALSAELFETGLGQREHGFEVRRVNGRGRQGGLDLGGAGARGHQGVRDGGRVFDPAAFDTDTDHGSLGGERGAAAAEDRRPRRPGRSEDQAAAGGQRRVDNGTATIRPTSGPNDRPGPTVDATSHAPTPGNT